MKTSYEAGKKRREKYHTKIANDPMNADKYVKEEIKEVEEAAKTNPLNQEELTKRILMLERLLMTWIGSHEGFTPELAKPTEVHVHMHPDAINKEER